MKFSFYSICIKTVGGIFMKRKVDFSLLPEGEFYLVLLRTGCVAVALKEYNSGDFWLLNSKQGKISKSKILYTSPFSEAHFQNILMKIVMTFR